MIIARKTIFYGDGPTILRRRAGNRQGRRNRKQREQILTIGNREHDFYYCKHDGSLDDGFEIVSHPATAEYI